MPDTYTDAKGQVVNPITYSTPTTTIQESSLYSTSSVGSSQNLVQDVNWEETSFTNPDNSLGIGFGVETGLVWYDIIGIPVGEQRNKIRPSQPTVTEAADKKRYYFKFLGSQELVESLSHDWQAYESLSQNIQSLYGTVGITSLQQASALMSTLGIDTSKTSGIGDVLGQIGAKYKAAKTENANMFEALGKATQQLIAEEVVKPWRVDTPLVYKNTERRVFELVFNLVSMSDNNFKSVVQPVRMLEALSSPSRPEEQAAYNPLVISPYVFRVQTYCYPNIDYKTATLFVEWAALKSINPVWKGPWVSGYPSRCELRLSFQEVEPVYSSTFTGKRYTDVEVIPGDFR